MYIWWSFQEWLTERRRPTLNMYSITSFGCGPWMNEKRKKRNYGDYSIISSLYFMTVGMIWWTHAPIAMSFPSWCSESPLGHLRPTPSQAFEHLVHSLWHFAGRFRRGGLVGGSMTLKVSFESLRTAFWVYSLSHLWFCHHIFTLSSWTWTHWNCSPNKLFWQMCWSCGFIITIKSN